MHVTFGCDFFWYVYTPCFFSISSPQDPDPLFREMRIMLHKTPHKSEGMFLLLVKKRVWILSPVITKETTINTNITIYRCSSGEEKGTNISKKNSSMSIIIRHTVTHVRYKQEIFFEVYVINDTGYVKCINYILYFTFLTHLSMLNIKDQPSYILYSLSFHSHIFLSEI